MRKTTWKRTRRKTVVSVVSLAICLGFGFINPDVCGVGKVYAGTRVVFELPAESETVPQLSERPFASMIPTPSPTPSFLCTEEPSQEASEPPVPTTQVPMPSGKPPAPSTEKPPSTEKLPSTDEPMGSVSPPQSPKPPEEENPPTAAVIPSREPVESSAPKPSQGGVIAPVHTPFPEGPDQNTSSGDSQEVPGGLLLPGLFPGKVGTYDSMGHIRDGQVLMPGILSSLFTRDSRTVYGKIENVRGDTRHVDIKQVIHSRAHTVVKPSQTGDAAHGSSYILLMIGSLCFIFAEIWNKHRKKEEEPI